MPLIICSCLRLRNRPLPGQTSFHCGGGTAHCQEPRHRKLNGQAYGGTVSLPAKCYRLVIHHQGDSSSQSPRLPCGSSDSTAAFPELIRGFSPLLCCTPRGGRLTPTTFAFTQPVTLTLGPLSEVTLSPAGTQPLRSCRDSDSFCKQTGK